jgi:hypothetical protein
LPPKSNAKLRMTGVPFNKLTNGDRDAILTAIADLGNRMERRFEAADKRFEKIEDEIKVMKYDVIEAKLSVRNLPTYWHMYVALTGLVVTVFSLMRFAMPGH